MSAHTLLRVALAGNPNAGKTTIFNALTGAHYKVGNYPGVTVEKREGSRRRGEREYRFIDLPGIYSLTAYSIDEVVARDFLLDERPDLIVDVLDSGNLERHLYLCLQFQELGIPVVGALNMSDEAEAKGVRIDEGALSRLLGLPMVKTVGSRAEGMEALLDAIDQAAASPEPGGKRIAYGPEIESRLGPLEAAISSDAAFASRFPPRWMAIKLLEGDSDADERLAAHPDAQAIRAMAAESAKWISAHYGRAAEIVVSEQRYGYIHGAVREAVRIERKPDFSVTEAIDRVVMNKYLALPTFAAVLWLIFQATFSLGAWPMAWLEALFGALSAFLNGRMSEGPVRSLLVDGVIGGVGGVMSFVPLVVILFFLLSILEDSGYMSRAAFATDKLLHGFGLHGQSIFPLMMGFGCSVPAIMAARTLKSRRDRIITVLVIPFMSCGAKLPVHVLLAAAFFPRHAGAMVMLVYAAGVALALLSSMVLRKTVLRGEPTPFVMELPPYRAPTLGGILWHVWDKTRQYLRKAGTVILAASVLIWAITSFPSWKPDDSDIRTLSAEASLAEADPATLQARIDAMIERERLERSAAGRLGKIIEPVFKPLGLDWKAGVASITGAAAKEIVVSTLGVLYGQASGGDQSLRASLRADPGFSPLAALVLMLFTLVAPPCFAALAAIRAELGWGWLAFSIVSLACLAWILGFSVYQLGSLFLPALSSGALP